MCNHIKVDGSQCKYKPNQEWCGYHDPAKRKVRAERANIQEDFTNRGERDLKADLILEQVRKEMRDGFEKIRKMLFDKDGVFCLKNIFVPPIDEKTTSNGDHDFDIFFFEDMSEQILGAVEDGVSMFNNHIRETNTTIKDLIKERFNDVMVTIVKQITHMHDEVIKAINVLSSNLNEMNRQTNNVGNTRRRRSSLWTF
ncbi:hypothetical protein DL89DRAFT_287340 [Linderina pennispora]|uniref:Uncharacterized protein n=1 Tax=Linderina pennispora TaxID=61395 RepID=A0A1Y1VV68_9FUNG|nr:uncharacterized protein DL89DRAFT_287340 [Linderina pennispora]ORX65177.1 hypothetical protein DL89DRAFT_287340 [Linderina pennispora]